MATIKLKFRPSTVQGKAGTLCYQLCHRQENRHHRHEDISRVVE